MRDRWFNLFDRLDPVCGFDPKLANDYQRSNQDAVLDQEVVTDEARRVYDAAAGELSREAVEWAAGRLWRLEQEVELVREEGARVRAVIKGITVRGELVVECEGGVRVLPGGWEVAD